ncbi:MAG: retropepsin-like aspartic protease [Candidatus Omnitrophota bacterium]
MRFDKLSLFLVLSFVFGVNSYCYEAETNNREIIIVELTNGGTIKGTLIREDEKGIVVDIGYGEVGMTRNEIKRIIRPEGADQKEVVQLINKAKNQIEESRELSKFEHHVRYTGDQEIIVEAFLNNKVRVSLLVDTGATTVVLSKETAKNLFAGEKGFSEKVEVKMADGGIKEAFRGKLRTITVGTAKAENIEAIVTELGDRDGVLGMSFLNRFHIKFDSGKKQLIIKQKYKDGTRF